MRANQFVLTFIGALALIPAANAALILGDTIGIDFQPTQARADAVGGTLATGTNFNVFDIDTDDDGLSIAVDGDDLDSTATIAAGTLINTSGATVSGVSFSLTNNTTQDTLRATFANQGTDGALPPSLLNEMAVWQDGYISNNQGGSLGIPSGGNFVLTFSGLDDSLTYVLEGGWDNDNGSGNFNMNWAADGKDFTTDIAGAAGAGYGKLSGLSTDGAGNLVITVTEANDPDHVVIGGLTLTAVPEPSAAILAGAGGFFLLLRRNRRS
ncbi:PEP-CTERM sorting domain-containing protein [Haloferula chungangensis]|uniref:PEP-CTERM sorting domain-containing protein n=1 Tax=Haloferula chungangensis TaxID=1048331 RepID=A0ABW2L8K9_9BACT